MEKKTWALMIAGMLVSSATSLFVFIMLDRFGWRICPISFGVGLVGSLVCAVLLVEADSDERQVKENEVNDE